jgi:uncharacterized protein (DUF58 family)
MAKDTSGHKFKYLVPEILQRIGALELGAREAVEGTRVGMHKSPLRGFSTEFAQHRQYVPGDAVRHLDWRVYGRTSRYYVKLYEAETNFAANLLLDASSSMRYGSGKVNKLQYASYMAATLAHLIVSQRDTVGLAVFDSALREYIEPKSSQSVVRNIAEVLERTVDEPRTNVAVLLNEFANRMTRRGFVIVFSDLFDNVPEFLEGLEHLRFRGHNVIVFHVMDPYELEFPFNGTWRFEGLELEGEITTQPKRIRAAYLEEVRKFTTEIRTSCEKSQIDYMLVNTARPVEEVLSAYLIGRVRTFTGTMRK